MFVTFIVFNMVMVCYLKALTDVVICSFLLVMFTNDSRKDTADKTVLARIAVTVRLCGPYYYIRVSCVLGYVMSKRQMLLKCTVLF